MMRWMTIIGERELRIRNALEERKIKENKREKMR